MRILLLADINSVHTQKWACALSEAGFTIGIFSFNSPKNNWYGGKDIHALNSTAFKHVSNSFLKKISYFFLLPKLIYSIHKFKPEVLHSHYASSYGLLGALTFFKPFMVSVWGSDILQFPERNFLNKTIMRFVFLRAHKISCTSGVLKKEISKYTSKQCLVIPFGVNLELFYDRKYKHNENTFTFGCVKHFEKIYNLDKVVLAFGMLARKYPLHNFKLVLIGNGSQKKEIEDQSNSLGKNAIIEFPGIVTNKEVPHYLNHFDVFVNVSEYESFGVSVAEAMACKVPVIVSNAEGFKDLVPDSSNAIVTKSTLPEDIFKAMEDYFLHAERMKSAANNSYNLVREKFNWKRNIQQMEEVYFGFLSAA